VTAEQPGDDYAAQVAREIRIFDDRRAVISRDLAAGTLDVRKAAAEWIKAAEEHLAALRLIADSRAHAADPRWLS
jgi:hypothetical protein